MQWLLTSFCLLLRNPSCYIVLSVTCKYTYSSFRIFVKILHTWAAEHMVFFQNTSQKCWLTNGLRNLAIALWLIFKKKKQWNKILILGPIILKYIFLFFTKPHWLPFSPSMLPLLAYFCLLVWTWQWAWPKSRAYFCKKGFWVCNSCTTTLASPGCCARLEQWEWPCWSALTQHRCAVSRTKVCDYLCSQREREREQRGMQWLTGNILGMEMTLETRLSFIKPSTYRPLLSPELPILNGVNWPQRSSLGGNVGRSRIDDTFVRRKWANLFAHTFCTTLKQRVALHEYMVLWELSIFRTFIQ